MDDLESAVSDGGDTVKLREKLVNNFSPDQIERLRAKLYDKLGAAEGAAAHKVAQRFLSALPPRTASGGARSDAGSRLDPGGMSNDLVRGDPRGTLQHAFPKPAPGRGDPLEDLSQGQGVQDILLGTMGAGASRLVGETLPAAEAAAEEASPFIRRIAGRVRGAIDGRGGNIASGVTKLGTGAAVGAGGAASAGGDPKMGALMGLALSAPGAGLDMMNSPLLPTSDIIAATEAGGGKIGFGGARGLRAPEAQGLPPGPRGEVELGVRGQQRLLGDMERRRAEMKAEIEAGEESAIARNGDQPIDTTKMREKLGSIAQTRSMDSGMSLSPLADEARTIDRALQRPGVPNVRVVGGARGEPGSQPGYEPLNPHGGSAGRPATPKSYNPLRVRGGEEGGRSSGVRYDGSGRMILPTEEVASGSGAHPAGGEMVPGSPAVPGGAGAVPSGGRMVPGSDPVLSGQGARYETVPGKPLNEITLREAIALKKALRERADPGGPPTAGSNAARAVGGELADIGHGADPVYDEALNRFSGGSTKLERANDVFGGKPTTELPDRASVERGMQKRIGELGRDPYLTRQALEVAKDNPEWSDLINAAVAHNGLRLRILGGGSPQSPGFRSLMGDAQALSLRTAPIGRASNANLPFISLETAAEEGGRRRKRDKSKSSHTDKGVE